MTEETPRRNRELHSLVTEEDWERWMMRSENWVHREDWIAWMVEHGYMEASEASG